MKKLLSLFLVLALLLALVGCGGGADLDQELEDLENFLGTFQEIGQGVYSDTEGAEETQGDSEDAQEGNNLEYSGEVSGEVSDEIVEYFSEGVATDATETAVETVADETEENELPMDIFQPVESTTPAVTVAAIDEDGTYTSMEDVALYIHTYGKLPKNFITKDEARALGWEGGYLEPYAPGKCIGGDRFGNYEGLLPTNRKYKECDIDTLGAKSRGAKRIVFSDDGLIYYTDDHYESFTLLYGEE